MDFFLSPSGGGILSREHQYPGNVFREYGSHLNLQLPIEKAKIQLIIKNLYFVFLSLVKPINDKDKPMPRQKFELLGIIIQDAICFSIDVRGSLQ